jgi:hypothetical protein
MTSSSAREEIKVKDRTASFMKMEAVCSCERPVTIIIRQVAVLTCESAVNISIYLIISILCYVRLC